MYLVQFSNHWQSAGAPFVQLYWALQSQETVSAEFGCIVNRLKLFILTVDVIISTLGGVVAVMMKFVSEVSDSPPSKQAL